MTTRLGEMETRGDQISLTQFGLEPGKGVALQLTPHELAYIQLEKHQAQDLARVLEVWVAGGLEAMAYIDRDDDLDIVEASYELEREALQEEADEPGEWEFPIPYNPAADRLERGEEPYPKPETELPDGLTEDDLAWEVGTEAGHILLNVGPRALENAGELELSIGAALGLAGALMDAARDLLEEIYEDNALHEELLQDRELLDELLDGEPSELHDKLRELRDRLEGGAEA